MFHGTSNAKSIIPSTFIKELPTLGVALSSKPYIISERIRKTMPTSDLKPREAPLRPGWAHGPMTGLSAGGLLAASCQKQRGGEVVLY